VAKAARSDVAKIPARIRFKAWWEGYNAAELFASITPPIVEPEINLTPAEIPITLRAEPIPDAQIQVAQLVWGEGFADPHAAFLFDQAKHYKTESAMIANAGLGGVQAKLIAECGMIADGYDLRSGLVTAALAKQNREARNNAPPLIALELAQVKPFLRRYDLALIDSLFSSVSDRLTLANTVSGTMSASSTLVLQDWFQESDMPQSELKRSIAKIGNPEFSGLWSSQEIINSFTERGFVLVSEMDITAQYAALIADSWRNLHDLMVNPAGATLVPGIMPTLQREIEKWQVRLALARDGIMHVKGIVLTKAN
jgi:hypothetical protein